MDNRVAIAWCVPEPIQGGGGFRTILQNASALEKAGFDCDFYFYISETSSVDLEEIKKNVKLWFDYDIKGAYYAYLLEKNMIC